MTSASFATSGTDNHPEVAEISALTEGLLPPGRSADVRTHLSDCTLCADVRTSLDEIRSALGTLPGPPRMPDDIAGRIDAALAAEALLNATAPESAADVPHAPSPLGTQRPSAAPPRAASPAGYGTVSRETARPPGQPSAATGPGRQPSRKTRRRRTALLSATGALAALAFGAFFMPGLLSSDSGSRSPGNTAQAGQETATSGRGLTTASLEHQVHSLLATAPQANTRGAQEKSAPGIGAKGSSTASPLHQQGTAIPVCVQRGIDRSEPPLAASEETFEGSPAYLVVLQHPGDEQRVNAYVVDASCVTQSPGTPGSVLAVRTFDRR
ncbi:hypothetical protein [Streptomyces gobiensis]|uniref:hypothetical protein n=1 Tax=Streptomyces gobiensis TaxID=2875706 RepID=UPI001E3EBA84|nr:hypothetical protein [Streptomyces gobiensis]UGY92549.1 hypothetical protein test1122_13005 [Streptomyces gobiensis]